MHDNNPAPARHLTARNDDVSVSWLLGWPAMLVGVLIGLAVAEFRWQLVHPQGIGQRGYPPRDLTHYLLTILCMVSAGVVGLALARFRDIPTGEEKGIGNED